MLRKPIRKRRAGKPRRGPLRDRGYLAFLRMHGVCIACQPHWRANQNLFGTDYCDPAHFRTNGTSSKGPDNEAIPLCRTHHDEQHGIGFAPFQAKYRFNWISKAAEWWTAYQEFKQRKEVA